MKQRIYKLLSMVLAVILVVSCYTVALNVTAEDTTVPVYYLSPSGTLENDGLSPETPLSSLNAIIVAANTAGYGEGDTVYVKVLGTTVTKWYDNDEVTLTPHDFKLNISSDTSGAIIGDWAKSVAFGGEIEFSNIMVGNAEGTAIMDFNNQNIIFGAGSSFAAGANARTATSNASDVIDDFNLYFSCATPNNSYGIIIGSYNQERDIIGTDNDKVNVNVTVNSGTRAGFAFGTQKDNWKYVEYKNCNINFNLVSASSFGIVTAKNPLFYTTSAIQIINSSKDDALIAGAKDYIAGLKNTDATDTTVRAFIIDNDLFDGAIAFTETAGKYKVDLDPAIFSDIALVNKADETVKAELDADGYITVTAPGEYKLVATKKTNLKATIYVSAAGNDANDGKTANTPVATVAGAVAAAQKAGYGEGDTVNVKAIKAEGTIAWGTVSAYAFALNISSVNADEKSTLHVGSLSGDVVIGNINLDNNSNTGNIDLLGNSITLDKGAVTGGSATIDLGKSSGQTIAKTQNVIINNDFHSSIVIGHNGQGSHTWNKDLNIIVNSASAAPKISFQTYWGGTKTINGNFNIILNANAAITFGTPAGTRGDRNYSTTVAGAVNVIVPEGATVTNKDNITTNLGDKNYFIVNKTSDSKAIELTAYAGKYKVNLDPNLFDSIALVNNADENIKSELDADGYITVTTPGEYNLVGVMEANTTNTYYVSPIGNDRYTGTQKAPLKTIGGAIATATAAGYGAGDTVYIKLVKVTDIAEGATEVTEIKQQWGTLTAHDFKVDISSYGDKATLDMGKGISLTGDIELSNLKLSWADGGWVAFNFCGKNVAFGSGLEYFTTYKLDRFINTWKVTNMPDEINYYFESLPKALIFGGWDNAAIFKNVNITLANGFSSGFKFGDSATATKVTTFNGNFNINDKGAKTVSFADSTGAIEFTENFAAQLINSSGETSITTNFVTYFSGKTIKDTDTAVPYYVINNNTDNKNAITFTENAGIYKVSGLPIGKSLWVYNKDGEFVKKAANNSTMTLEPGEYDINIGEGTIDYSFDIAEDTSIADTVQTAIDMGADATDTVTINVTSDTNFGGLPKYNFDLLIKSPNKATITVDNGLIANNAGMTTEYKNVVINNPTEYGSFELAHSNAIFHKDASFLGADSKLIFGYNNVGQATEIVHDQTVEINCKTPPNIALSNGINGRKVYSGDVNLIINHKDASTRLYFNAYYEGVPHYTTQYNGNVNINIKDAKTINLESGWDSNISFGENSHIQFMIDGSTTFDWDILATKLTENSLKDKAVIIFDKTFQRRCVDFTETAGTFAINNPYKVTATKIKTISNGTFAELTGSDKVVKTAENNQFTVDFGSNVWELTTNEYFEDFNDTTLDELRRDWTFTGDKRSSFTPTTLTDDGRLLISSVGYVMEYNDPNKNYNLNSKEQYISVDLQPVDFGWYNGFTLFARATKAKGYAFRLCAAQNGLSLVKYDGEDRSAAGSHYASNLDGVEYEGLMEYRPSGKNDVSFTSSHVYRMGLSVTTDYDKDGNEVAIIRGILFDITSNTLIYDETYRDTKPYTGTEVLMYSPHGVSAPGNVLCYPYVDNFYFSTEKFREGDDGWYLNDINGDGIYDIRDLVLTNDSLNDDNANQTILYKADRDLSGTINSGDITVIRKEILDELELSKKEEFKLSGESDAEAETMRQNILNSTSSYSNKKYTSNATVRENGKYVTKSATYTGKSVYYVANNASGNGSGSSSNNAMSLENFAADLQTNRANYSSAIILFKRGETYRLNTDKLAKNGSAYAYFVAPSGTEANPTIFGAFGSGDKPRFTSSVKDYAKDVIWKEVGGKNANVWVIDAPEFILEGAVDPAPTNVIFDNGDTVGLRKGFPVGLDPQNEKLYTLYNQGDFAYDEANKKLYLYSLYNPNQYDSIEISRGIICISLVFGADYFVVDNLNIHGFGRFAIQGPTGNQGLTVTNCEIGFSGGVKHQNTVEAVNRYGNAIEFWDGGADFHVNYNWIYQTWDSAITTQANAGRNHNGMQVKGNLLEYNNADIEIFDSAGSKRDNTEWTDNIMRFTTLGWGSRNVSRIRNIHGIIRGGVTGATVVSIDWTNNIVDTPGMQIIMFNNLTEYTTQTVDGSEKNVYSGIFNFGKSYNSTDESLIGNNTYYINPYVRARTSMITRYNETMPEDRFSNNKGYSVQTKEELYDVMKKFDNAPTSKFYFLGKEVTSGS